MHRDDIVMKERTNANGKERDRRNKVETAQQICISQIHSTLAIESISQIPPLNLLLLIFWCLYCFLHTRLRAL